MQPNSKSQTDDSARSMISTFVVGMVALILKGLLIARWWSQRKKRLANRRTE